jgi:acrosin
MMEIPMRFLKTMTSFLTSPKPKGRSRPSHPTRRLGIESLERRDVPTTIPGTALPDTFVLQPDPLTGLPQVVLNGAVVFTGNPTLNQFVLNGGDDTDTFTVNATFAGITTTVNGGDDDDKILIAAAGQSLDAIDDVVTVNGDDGNDTLLVNDQANTRADTFQLTGTTVDRNLAAMITHGTVETVTVNLGSGGVTLNLESTASGVSTVVNGGGGKDAFNITPVGQFLDTLDGPVTVNGGAGADTLTIHDELDGFDDDYVITGTTVDRNFSSPISYSSMGGGVVIEGGSGDLTFDIEGTMAGNPVTVNDNSLGTTKFDITPVGKNLNAVAGKLTLSGGSGSNSINVHDESNATQVTYTLSVDTLGRTGAATIAADFDNMPLVLNGGSANNVFDVTEAPELTSFKVIGGVGMDSLLAPNEVNVFEITGANKGEVNYALGDLFFEDVESLTGDAQADTFRYLGGSISGVFSGGAGTDVLDYSSAIFSVTVNLLDGTASQTGGVSGIEDVIGGFADDILIGNGGANNLDGNGGDDVIVGSAGNDIINGDAGFDVLIGGAGSDDIQGGGDGDILIGGSTSFGTDIPFLMSISAEWQSTNNYNTRVNHLRGTVGGGANGGNLLVSAAGAGQTVFVDDGAPDTLGGGAGTDWFFYGGADLAPILAPGEQVN